MRARWVADAETTRPARHHCRFVLIELLQRDPERIGHDVAGQSRPDPPCGVASERWARVSNQRRKHIGAGIGSHGWHVQVRHRTNTCLPTTRLFIKIHWRGRATGS